MEPAKSVLGVKAKVRQRIREEGVPYTIVCGALAANWYFLPRIGQAEASGPPTDKVYILGDGNTKGNKHIAPIQFCFQIQVLILILRIIMFWIPLISCVGWRRGCCKIHDQSC